MHLEPSYAQAHPAEDFAETFAVWLKPRSGWRTHYEGWPAFKKLEYVANLMQEIQGKRPKVTSRELLSGPEEAQAGAQLAQELAQVEGIQSWIGQRGLRELAGAFTAAARAGVRYVGVDSGPLHLAAACGVSVVALEGPQSHLRTGPWPVPERDGAQPRHRVVRSDEPLACAPCFSRRCQHAEGPVCMSRLSTQGVLLALENPRV
jgi:ADP-heptose:LPS heptosyltransferase